MYFFLVMSFCTCHLRATHVDMKLLAEFDSGIRVLVLTGKLVFRMQGCFGSVVLD